MSTLSPATGGYGSRSVYFGPYGGYSYNQAYNPATGRYGYVETGWNGEEWASYGQTYNPRTGVSSETSRNYDYDSGKASMDRTVQRGDNSITTERDTDFANNTQTVNRESSGGGSQQAQRQVQDGQVTGSGTITAADGRTLQTETKSTVGEGGTVSMAGSEGGTGTIDTTRTSGAASSRDMSQLNRDYSARQTGNRQFASRSGGMRSGGRSRRR